MFFSPTLAAIIATLATGYMLATATLLESMGCRLHPVDSADAAIARYFPGLAGPLDIEIGQGPDG